MTYVPLFHRVRRRILWVTAATEVGVPAAATKTFPHARRLSWPGGRPPRAFFAWLDQAIGPHPGTKVALVVAQQCETWKELFARARPDAVLTVVAEGENRSDTHVRLGLAGPFDVVLQAADVPAVVQARWFQRVFFHLRENGVYLTPRIVPLASEELASLEALAAREAVLSLSGKALPNEDSVPEPEYVGDVWRLVSEAQGSRLTDFADEAGAGLRFRDVRGLGRHLHKTEVLSKMLRITNGRRTQVKLDEGQADAVLTARPDLGLELVSLPPTTMTGSGAYVHNLERDDYFVSSMTVPKLTLRRYNRPWCSRGQIVSSRDFLLPDTFRHHRAPRLQNIYVEESAPLFGYVRRDLSQAEELTGRWFWLDSEWPGHFGHTLTEVLGRMWAWDEVKRQAPDVKCLLTLQHDRVPAELLPFELDIFDALGIGTDAIHVFDGPCRPETLFSATSMFSLPDYVHPDMLATWRRVGDHLAARASPGSKPRRIFCTRPTALKRRCHNASEVEALFARHGFEVIRPEEHPLAEQVAMFRSAEAVGGFAGSGLFTLALCDSPKPVFTVGPQSYTARNEHLIAAACGHDVVSTWSQPDLPHPAGSWTQSAYASDFTFDLEAEGAFLEEQLSLLGD